MLSKHGCLESAIMSALWILESKGDFKNAVSDVFDILSQNDIEKRAYTTIKTVMDRLCEKRVLLRFKEGRKFYYRTAYSHQEVLVNSLREISNRYCAGDLNKLSNVLNSMLAQGELVGV